MRTLWFICNREENKYNEALPIKDRALYGVWGVGIASYYSRGHHDKEKFLKALEYAYDYQGNIEDIFYTNIKLSLSSTGGMMVNFRKEPCKGSFPATVIEV